MMEYNEIGKICSTHALKGEVKVKSDTSFIEERFKVGSKVYYKDGDNYKELVVRSHRSMKDYELIAFSGYDDINQVMQFINKTIYGIKDRNLLKDGTNFYSDFVGLDCYMFNELKGKVLDIISYPTCDYLRIKGIDSKEKLVPLLREFIECVDLDNNKLVLKDMEGLL